MCIASANVLWNVSLDSMRTRWNGKKQHNTIAHLKTRTPGNESGYKTANLTFSMKRFFVVYWWITNIKYKLLEKHVRATYSEERAPPEVASGLR